MIAPLFERTEEYEYEDNHKNWVYLFFRLPPRLFKVGKGNAPARKRAFDTASPDASQMVAYRVQNMDVIEKMLHGWFADVRIWRRGVATEWFDLYSYYGVQHHPRSYDGTYGGCRAEREAPQHLGEYELNIWHTIRIDVMTAGMMTEHADVDCDDLN